MNISKKSWLEKRMDKFPSKHKGTLFTLICILLVILQIVTQKSCMETLLPICIPWMYYQYVVLGISLLPFIINPITKYFTKSSGKGKSFSESYVWILIVASIIIPAIIFLPNRHIPIGVEKECLGIVVDKTSAPVNKSPSSERNYVKVRLDGENTSFWYCLNKESKPLGSRCIASVRKGILGMRYVEKVDFLEE
jgi:hypothetical protein